MKKGKSSKKDRKKSPQKKSKYKLMFNFGNKVSKTPEDTNSINSMNNKSEEITKPKSNLLDVSQKNPSLTTIKTDMNDGKKFDVIATDVNKDSIAKKLVDKTNQDMLLNSLNNSNNIETEIVIKKRFDIVKILSEIFFWGGLILVVAGLIMSLENPLIPTAGLVAMVISIILYALSLRKHVAKNPIKDEKKTEAKKEAENKLDINSELNKAIADRKSRQESPIGKEIKIKSKLTDEQRAEKELNKNYLKKIITIIIILFIFVAILLVLNRYDSLFKIQGAAVIAIFIAVIIIWILQGKKKTHIQHQTGIMSKPSIEIETKIKNLKDSETEIDLFYEFIKENKSVLVTTIAHEFGITVDKVEEWAKILETHNLIIIYYPAFGSPSLKILEKKKE